MKKKKQHSNGRIDGDESAMSSNSRRRKTQQRLGGKGLSLQAFANAKSKRGDYNPAVIKKQREFYKNAKCVSKYKKSLKQQSDFQSCNFPAAQVPEGGGDDHEIGNSMKIKKKKKNSLQSLRDEYEKRQEEEEKARMERELIIQAKKEERERVEARRKALKEKMFKKTRSGQPIMKYRIEHILEGIQHSKN